MSKPVIAYVRVSTSAQLEGNGIQQQQQAICMYAAANGLHIDEWVCDDETGTTEDREGIVALLSRANDFTLLYDRQDRLGRTLLVCENLVAKFKAKGTELVCVQQKFDDSPWGRAMRQMMGVFAELQRSEMLIRMQACKKAAVRKKGTFQGGRPPTGYRSIGEGKLAIDERGAELVRTCFELRDAGLTVVEIVSALEARGFRTRANTAISPVQVRRILKRKESYAGRAAIGSTVQLDTGVTAAHPALLEIPMLHGQSDQEAGSGQTGPRMAS